jgi:peptidoglycan DL-endopeptidase CwlO
MTAGRSDLRTIKIRRRGRHSSPSQVEKVALQAGKAAPAVAIAGVLVAGTANQALAETVAPAATAAAGQLADTAAGTGTATASEVAAQAALATLETFETHAVTLAAYTPAAPAKHAAVATTTHYTVRDGDTLANIASRFYHKAADWQYLYHVNAKTIADPDAIFAGQKLVVPATVPANFKLTSYTPKHAKPAATATPAPATRTLTHSSTGGSTTATTDVVVQSAARTTASGSYSCSGLESLWDAAGGNPAHAVMAAEIAMAESGGNPNAISPTDDFGLWQINGSNGALATLSPSGNAHSAIVLSDNGSNWNAWTTYHSGAYSGRC